MPRKFTPQQLDRFQQKYNKLSAKESLRPAQQTLMNKLSNRLGRAGMLPSLDRTPNPFTVDSYPIDQITPKTPIDVGTGSSPVKPSNPGVISPPGTAIDVGTGSPPVNPANPGVLPMPPGMQNTQALNTGAPAPTVGMKKGGKVKSEPTSSVRGWGKARGARAAKIY